MFASQLLFHPHKASPLSQGFSKMSFYDANIGNIVEREFKMLEKKEEDLEHIG